MEISNIDKLEYTSDELFDLLLIDHTLISEGACFYVLENDNRIFKFQKTHSNSNQIKEIKAWFNFCSNNQSSSYVPKIIDSCIFNCSNESILFVEVEKLIHLDSNSICDIKHIFGSYINVNVLDIEQNLIEQIAAKTLNTYHIKETVDHYFLDFLNHLIVSTKEFARKLGDTLFSMDLHFNNFMIRPSTGQLVIIDYFSCSLYDFE